MRGSCPRDLLNRAPRRWNAAATVVRKRRHLHQRHACRLARVRTRAGSPGAAPLAASVSNAVTAAVRKVRARIIATTSADGEDALHARGGVSGHGAGVEVPAFLLEDDDQLRRLTRLDGRRRSPVDLEVVDDVSDVLENERDSCGPCDQLARAIEE